jgi:hypothetical protein
MIEMASVVALLFKMFEACKRDDGLKGENYKCLEQDLKDEYKFNLSNIKWDINGLARALYYGVFDGILNDKDECEQFYNLVNAANFKKYWNDSEYSLGVFRTIINRFTNFTDKHFSLKHNVGEFITGLFHECFIVYHWKKVEIDKSHIHQKQV